MGLKDLQILPRASASQIKDKATSFLVSAYADTLSGKLFCTSEELKSKYTNYP